MRSKSSAVGGAAFAGSLVVMARNVMAVSFVVLRAFA
jgi:hypothetical protein